MEDLQFGSICPTIAGSDIIALALDTSLSEGNNPNLWKLDLHDLHFESNASHEALFRALGSARSLRHLDLSDCEMGDGGIKKVCHALSVSQSLLGHLDLSGNDVTRHGAKDIADYIHDCRGNLKTALMELCLESCNLDDVGACFIVMALAGYSSLKELDLSSNDDITGINWEDIVHLICDTTSIGSIYSSNHTFQKLSIDHLAFPEDVASLLTLNQNKEKVEVARQKILKYHFSDGGDNASAFAQMSEVLLPFALEWIGRTVSELSLSLMYDVTRGNPTLFDSAHHAQQHLRALKQRK